MGFHPCDPDGYCEALAGDNARSKIRALEAELAAESKKVGELQTRLDITNSIDSQFGARVAIEIRKLHEELETWRRWRPFLLAFSNWGFVPHPHGSVWEPLGRSWLGDGNIPKAGGEPKAKNAEPDPCPLPATVDGWKWEGKSENWIDRATLGSWTLEVSKWNGLITRWVYFAGKIAEARPCKTVKSGKKMAVAEARRLWRLRIGVMGP